ncbi:MAG: hypothetical protein PVG27_00480 [Chloroflexota bacterium]|jgi:hypothetical protein
MDRSVSRPRSLSLTPAIAIAIASVALLVAALPAAAFHSEWTKPKRVYEAGYAPTHAMVTDGAGATHIAIERGSSGLWYVTNASGSWTQCRLTSLNDRQPSIGVAGSVVHVAFARQVDGQRGIWTVSSDQASGGGGCGWQATRRFAGNASHPSLGVYGPMLSIAFRTGAKQLKFIKGGAGSTSWTVKQTIDTDCCTSAPALALTHGGAPRVAYGDGTARANGLKYAVRTSSGWKKTKFVNGRIKEVALVLDHTPGLFPWDSPSNAPHVAFVRKGKGTYHATKSTSGVRGSWRVDFLRKAFGGVDLAHHSNLTYIVFTKNGDLWAARKTAILYTYRLGASGKDVKPHVHGGQLRMTFARRDGATGVYHVRER